MGGGPSGETSPATPSYGDSGYFATPPACSSPLLQVLSPLGLVLCSGSRVPGYPETGSVDSELEFLTLLPPPRQVLGLQVCTSMLGGCAYQASAV